MQGKTLRCSLSESKFRLFIGNVPKALTEDQFRKIIEDTGPGSENIELIKVQIISQESVRNYFLLLFCFIVCDVFWFQDPQNPTRNRGFAFVEYYNNACADYSRKKMTVGSFKLDGNTPTVTWAEPKSTPNSSSAAAAQVNINSPSNLSL